MKTADSFVNEQIIKGRITRSRFHYKPISSAELLLTIVLSTFIGVGVFVATLVNIQPEDNSSKIFNLTVEQPLNSVDTSLVSSTEP